MKKLTFAITFALIIMSLSVFGADKEICLKTNLHCGACKAKIEKSFKTINGIKSTKADVDSKVVTIKYDTDKISEQKIVSTFGDLGYTAELIKNEKKEVNESSKKECCDKDNLKSGKKTKESCCGKDGKKK